jgi:hypothetical protein
MSNPIRWRGQSADYTTAERLLMADLSVREQALVHTLKALTQGEIGAAVEKAKGSTVEVRPVPVQPEVRRPTAIASHQGTDAGTVYTDPEDIEFGSVCGSGKQRSSRKRPIYAVAWTWRQHKIHKTKKRCEQRLKVWKRWYERQGWTVRRMGTGYWADGPDGEKHVILLHEYDRDTKERLS